MSLRRALPLILAIVAIVGVALIANDDDDGGPAFSTESTGPLGARGLALLLEEEADATVRVVREPPRQDGEPTVALLLVDELGEEQTDEWRTWIEQGGVLVVADPFSPFAPPFAPPDTNLLDSEEDLSENYEPDCSFAPVREIGSIYAPDAALLRIRNTDIACFHRGRGAYLVARSEGDGTVVALGGPTPFVNENLATEDNAGLAVALLAPQPGTEVLVLQRDPAGSGRRTLTDLIPREVSSGLWQLAIAFLVIVLWRARRLGRPVVETDPVEVPGSELVVAVGNLLHRAKRRDAAAEMLRLQARRELCDHLGLPSDAPADQIAQAASAVPGIDAERVRSVLSPSVVLDDDSLVTLAATVESIRREVSHV